MFARNSVRRRGLRAVVACALITAACGGASSPDGSSAAEVPAVEERAAAGESNGTTTVVAPIGTAPRTDADADAEVDVGTSPDVQLLFAGDFVDLNGDPIDLASAQGQDVILWFWAPW